MDSNNNIPLGLKTQTQIPLDVKEYSINESTLSNLGQNNQLAYTYVKGLIVYCIEEGTRWEWKEVESGLENTGLISEDFTYPSGHIAFGINYSEKSFNFFLIPNSNSNVSQNNFVRLLKIPENLLSGVGSIKQQICDYILILPEEQRTILETDSKWNVQIIPTVVLKQIYVSVTDGNYLCDGTPRLCNIPIWHDGENDLPVYGDTLYTVSDGSELAFISAKMNISVGNSSDGIGTNNLGVSVTWPCL